MALEGTVVTLELEPTHRIPRHEALVEQLRSMVRLREVVRDPRRTIVVMRPQQDRKDQIRPLVYDGKKRLSERFSIPGYPGVDAKLVVCRAPKRFSREKDRFRLGGILVKSRHAIHEASLFDSGLESDPSAMWFYGKLTCEAIDDLWNEFDDRYANRLEPTKANPVPILDPSRKSGLTRDHPFVSALYSEALKRLRPLVEEERKREEKERSQIESRKTRKRLDALETAANEFLSDWSEDDMEDNTRDQEERTKGKRFLEHGYSLSPPFAQLVKGHSRLCTLSVLQDSFPELELGATVQVDCLTSEIKVDRRFVPLEQHPVREGVLRATWTVTAVEKTPATGLRVRVGAISAEASIEIFESEADRYAGVDALMFGSRRYRIRLDKGRKKVQVLAPMSLVQRHGNDLQVGVTGSDFRISGETSLTIREDLGVAIAAFTLKPMREKASITEISAALGDQLATAEVIPVEPPGAGIHIKFEDVDHGSYRYRWKKNDLEIAARHPSLARYLGDKAEGYPGQEERHFRVLLAEIVADAVCSELLRKNIQANPTDYENADWDRYFHEFSEYMTAFLPKAHALVVPDP